MYSRIIELIRLHHTKKVSCIFPRETEATALFIEKKLPKHLIFAQLLRQCHSKTFCYQLKSRYKKIPIAITFKK